MKKNFSFYNGAWIAVIVVLIACTDKKHEGDIQHDSTMHKHTGAKIYYCPMHPEVVSDKPGICPKCNMDLELRAEPKTIDTLAFLIQPSNHFVVSDMKAIVPSLNMGHQRIEAEGYLTYNPDNTISISANVSGRIERLYVTYNFQRVQKGQKLMELYSPELLTVQNEYLMLLHTQDSSDVLVLGAVTEKLLLLGMKDSDVRQLKKTGKANPLLTVYASAGGHVHFLSDNTNMETHAFSWPSEEKNGMQSAAGTTERVALRQGAYVNTGDNLFTISNDSGIWALLKIKPADIAQVHKGNSVDIYINGVAHQGSVNFIEQSFEPGSDFYTVRVYLSGDHHTNLTIGTLIHAYISPMQNTETTIWIPSAAVVNLGKSQGAVFIKNSPGYTAIKIRTGEYTADWVEIISGLKLSDSIAPIASYLVDSEAFIITDEQ